jgi:hypothetical protein
MREQLLEGFGRVSGSRKQIGEHVAKTFLHGMPLSRPLRVVLLVELKSGGSAAEVSTPLERRFA